MSCCTDYESGNVKISDYYSEVQPTWCSGCGNFGIWAALKRALVELEIPPQDVLLAFDIGCNGNMSDKIRGYRIHSLHGRVLPLAAGAKIANPNLKVIAMAGDGATYSEGVEHLVHSFRNNFPITFLVHDNGNYGLTTGQASATTPQDATRNSNPYGPTASTLSPVSFALSLNPGYIAQAFSGNIPEMTGIIKDAIARQDRGFSFVNILQACPTYNKETTHNWYYDRIKPIETVKDYDAQDLTQAFATNSDYAKNIFTGKLYENPDLPSYLDRIKANQPTFLGTKIDAKAKTSQLLKEFN